MAETAYVPRLRAEYDRKIKSQLTEKFGHSNVMQVPRLEKVVLNMGVGEAVNDRKKAETAAADLSLTLTTHRFDAGAVSYLDVVTAQTIALSNRLQAEDIAQRRMDASVALLKALGGPWAAAAS